MSETRESVVRRLSDRVSSASVTKASSMACGRRAFGLNQSSCLFM